MTDSFLQEPPVPPKCGRSTTKTSRIAATCCADRILSQRLPADGYRQLVLTLQSDEGPQAIPRGPLALCLIACIQAELPNEAVELPVSCAIEERPELGQRVNQDWSIRIL